MKAAVLRQVRQPLQIEDVQLSKPGPHEVLIRTVAAGVCHSDLHFIEGSYPHPLPAVLGHESAGIVEQVGSEVRTVKPGDHVITCLSAFCGHCEFCLTGHMSLCVSPETKRGKDEEPRLSAPTGLMMQFLNLSSFAEHMLIHEHACVAIRKDPPFDAEYLYITLMLEKLRGRTLVINDPRGLRDANEKLYTLHFSEFTPRTLVTSDRTRILSFLEKRPPAWVVAE